MRRRLIIGERIMYVDSSTPLNCVFAAKLKGVFSLPVLQLALRKIQHKHPLLQTCIKEDEHGVPYFISNHTVAEVPVRVVERTDNLQWQQESKAEWGKLFDEKNKPMFRVVWLQGETISEFLLVFPHCIGDGTSFVTLMSELLSLLDHPEKELSSYLPFNSVEGLLSSYKKTKGQVMKGKVFAVVAKLFFALKSTKMVRAQGNSYLLQWKMNKEQTAALVARCKQEGVTVHAALCIAFMQAFYKIKGKDAHGKVICPVDIRRFVPEIKQDMMFAFAPIAELSSSLAQKSDFWTKARKLKNELTAKIAVMKVPELLVMSEYFHATVHKMVKHLRSTAGTHDLTLSNMGKLGIAEQYDSFEVETVYSPNVAFPWRNPNTAIVSTYRGEMDFVFCSNDAFLKEEEAKMIQSETLILLQEEMELSYA